MKKVLVVTGHVIHREEKTGKLHVGYQGDEMILPDAVFARNRMKLELLQDLQADPGSEPVVQNTALTATRGKEAVAERVNRHHTQRQLQPRTVRHAVVSDSDVKDRVERQRLNRANAHRARIERQEKLKEQNAPVEVA